MVFGFGSRCLNVKLNKANRRVNLILINVAEALLTSLDVLHVSAAGTGSIAAVKIPHELLHQV